MESCVCGKFGKAFFGFNSCDRRSSCGGSRVVLKLTSPVLTIAQIFLSEVSMPDTKSVRHGKAVLYEIGTPLPSPLKVGRADVPQNLKLEIQQLMRPAPHAFLLQWVGAWLAIAACIFTAARLNSLWFSVAAIVIVATRQNLLALLMHEQTHWLCSRAKWADYFCEILIAFPLLVTLEGYRRVHLSHHSAYFTDDDPDYLRKQGEEWTFPQQRAYFFRMMVRDLAGLNLKQTMNSKGMSEASSFAKAQFAPPRWLRPAFFTALVVTLTLTHSWTSYLLYWALPLFTLMQLIIRWGAISEHKYNLIQPSVEESTPLIVLRWWERVCLPNLNFTLHIYHHWYPTVPACRLQKVHQLFQNAGLVDERNVFHGYGEYLHSLLVNEAERTLTAAASD
jgi:fatty acid desaturase